MYDNFLVKLHQLNVQSVYLHKEYDIYFYESSNCDGSSVRFGTKACDPKHLDLKKVNNNWYIRYGLKSNYCSGIAYSGESWYKSVNCSGCGGIKSF